MNTLRFRFLITLLVLPVLVSGCNISTGSHKGGYTFRDGGEKASKNDAGTLTGANAVEIDHRFGGVEITAGEGDPTWNWDLEVRGKDSEVADAILDEIRLEVSHEGTIARLVLVLPDKQPKGMLGMESRLKLVLPTDMDVKLSNSFGASTVSGVGGNTVLDCQHGAVTLRDIDGSLTARTSFAPLRATNVATATLNNQHGALSVAVVRGDLFARTSFGSMEVTTVDGHARVQNEHGAVTVTSVAKNANVRTSFASLQLTQVQGDAVIRNQHGSIRASEVIGSTEAATSFAPLTLDVASAQVDVRNQHGTLDLTLSGKQLDRVEAETSFAGMKLTLAAENELRITADTSFGKVRSDFPVNGPITSANPNLLLENQHGNIDILRK